MSDLVNRLRATAETGVSPELIDETIDRIRELEQRLAAVEGLPVKVRERMDKWSLRINVDNGRMVPPKPNQDGEWITVRMAHKMITDELQAALRPKAQNAEDCAG